MTNSNDLAPTPFPAMRCCYLEDGKADGTHCEKEAEFEIESDHTVTGNRDYYQMTQACADHVGHLLEDGASSVWPL